MQEIQAQRIIENSVSFHQAAPEIGHADGAVPAMLFGHTRGSLGFVAQIDYEFCCYEPQN